MMTLLVENLYVNKEIWSRASLSRTKTKGRALIRAVQGRKSYVKGISRFEEYSEKLAAPS